MGIFSRKPKGPHVLTFQRGQGLTIEVTSDDFHSTEAGLNEIAGKVRKDGEPHMRSFKVWLVRNDRQRVDVISQKTGERLGRLLGADGAELHDLMVKHEKGIDGPLHFATTMNAEVEWVPDSDDEWDAIWEAFIALANPIKAKLEPYMA
jgi:hypothetical protein